MVVGRVLRDVPGLLKRSDFFCFGKKSRFSFSSSVFPSVFPSLALSSKKNQKTHELRDLDVGLQIALESAEEDLSLARLEPVDHAGDGAAERRVLTLKKVFPRQQQRG
jgi:hypothetical protein